MLECAKEGNGVYETRIPKNHPTFEEEVLPIPGLIGVLLVGWKVDGKVPRALEPGQDKDAKTDFAPDAWQSGRVGTFLDARKDRKPLRSEHFESV